MSGRRQRGLGLVELMVSLGLALLLGGGLFQILLGTQRSYRLEETLATRQESLRYAVQVLRRDLAAAAYRGCQAPGVAPASTLEGVINAAGLQGFDAVGARWQPALEAGVSAVRAGTDVLTVRTPRGASLRLRTALLDPVADLRVDRGADLAREGGEWLLASDCAGATLFRSTGYDSASGLLAHAAQVGLAPQNVRASLGRRFAVGAEISVLDSTAYFIRASASGRGPALWRRVGSTPSEELVEGIENLQAEFAEGHGADGMPGAFVPAGGVGDWRRVVAVRVALLAASTMAGLDAPDPRRFQLLGQRVGPFADGRLRRAATITVSLRNGSA